MIVTTFPNPVTSVLNVKCDIPPADQAEIRLLDMSGKIVYRQELSGADMATKQIDMTGLAKGMYYVQLLYAGEESMNSPVYKN